MDDATYNRLLQKIEAEYKANVAALNRVRNLDRESSSDESPSRRERLAASLSAESVESAEASGSQKGQILNAVRSLLPLLPKQFTWRVVAAHAGVGFKEPSIRQALNRLVETKEIHVVRAGTGRAPNIYQVGA